MRYELRETEDEWSGAWCHVLVRVNDDGTEDDLMSDGWVQDAPEDAILTRGYSTLVDELNRLAGLL